MRVALLFVILLGLPLFANAKNYNCSHSGSSIKGYPDNFSLSAHEDFGPNDEAFYTTTYLNRILMVKVHFSRGTFLQQRGSRLFFSITGDYKGERIATAYDPNSYRAVYYICAE